MMPSLTKPSAQRVQTFLAQQREQPLSYREVGQSRTGSPAGYQVDHNCLKLGYGRDVYEAACEALRRWEMFPRSWTEVHPPQTSFEIGNTVAVLFQVFGLWWINACRIVSVINESQPSHRFGFAYGTLPSHVERGEEQFTIEWRSDDSVWYDIRAFSRPQLWFVRLGNPVARMLQRRFVLDSQSALLQVVGNTCSIVSPET